MIASLSQRIICISKAVADCFDRCKNSQKTTVVYNAVVTDQTNISDPRNSFRQEWNIPDDVPLVAQVTNITSVKGCEDFVHAAARVHQAIPEAVFLLVGGTPYPEYKQKLVSLISHYKLEQCFILTGFYRNVSDIFSIIDLLVLASHYEPFGRVLIEAMSMEKPVIGTQTGGIPEIIENGVTGLLVPPRSPEELAQAIIKILQNPEMARQMGMAGRKRAREHFSIEQYVSKIQEIYKELLT